MASNDEELFLGVSSVDFLGFAFGARGYSEQLASSIAKTEQTCAVSCHIRTLTTASGESIRVVWLTHNFRFLGGSLGCAEGEKLVRGFEYALENSLPVVVVSKTGGARMQEGTLSLMQLSKVSVAIAALRAAHLPYICVLLDPTYGGVPASYAMSADVRISSSKSRIGFAGPAVILNTMYGMDQAAFDAECPPSFQTAEYLAAHGQLDIVVTEEEIEAAGGADPAIDGVCAKICCVLCPDGAAVEVAAPEAPAAKAARAEADAVANAAGECSFQYTMAREMDRFQALDFINSVFTGFVELKGDGRVGDDNCIRGGLALLPGTAEEENRRCVVIGCYKGHTPTDFQNANYGMPSPAGYRKALRLFKLAETFGIPVVTLVDTPGALPSFDAERDGQSEAIATNLVSIASMKVPIIALVIGEGGSGGALGVGMGDAVGMLSAGYYGVISPEGAASILGRYKDDAQKALQFPKDCAELATMQKIYAPQLLELGVIDAIIWEEGDAEGTRDAAREDASSFPKLTKRVSEWLSKTLKRLCSLSPEALVGARYAKYRGMGKWSDLDETERAAAIAAAKEVPQPTRAPRVKVPASTSKLLAYIAEQTLVGPYSAFKGKQHVNLASYRAPPAYAAAATESAAMTAKKMLDAEGPEAMAQWVRAQTRPLLTDTTMRDAHQSLLATRVRSVDLVASCALANDLLRTAFSFEVWGGATFDVSLRFLHEDPWVRLRAIRAAAPDVCLQMLLRGSNAVGYTSYPDNVVTKFVAAAARNGIDVFRIFDCFNCLEQMEMAISAVRAANKVAEVCICFTGDFLSPGETVYTIEYYTDLARRIHAAGAHMIAIKDMAGLLKPGHAAPMIAAIRSVSDLPIHFHTHSTSGVSLASALAMAHAGCDVVDGAIASMSENTSQPNLNALVAALQYTPMDTGVDPMALEPLDVYWGSIRCIYGDFENGMTAGSARTFHHEIPGGQYSNLLVQAASMGLWSQWEKVLDTYRDVNKLFGNIVKVTPSSKVVGDLTLYLINRDISAADVLAAATGAGSEEIDFPQSTVDLCMGRIGFPHHGLPKELQSFVLKGVAPLARRPGMDLPPADFAAEKIKLEARMEGKEVSEEDILSSFLYPKVYQDYLDFLDANGAVTALPSITFWNGMTIGQSCTLTNELHFGALSPDGAASSDLGTEGAVTITLVRVSGLDGNGNRKLTFEVNGAKCTIVAKDAAEGNAVTAALADLDDPNQVPSPLPGTVEFIVAEGDKLSKGDTLAIVSAMKMEVKVTAQFDCVVANAEVKKGERVDEGSRLLTVESQ